MRSPAPDLITKNQVFEWVTEVETHNLRPVRPREFTAGANGEATVTTVTPAPITHDNAVLVVYHSDGIQHGMARGTIGIDAHHQLIARP